ncbi:MAG: hypothetical protein QM786_07585 [Breznakibacter sp.]
MKNRLALLGLIGLAAVSCEKGEGFGGTSTIKGVVMTEEWNAEFTRKKAADHPAQEKEVYLVFGDDDDFYGDKVDTDYQGRFEFKYLREGTYVVYVYSKDPTKNYDYTNEMMLVPDTLHISGKHQTIMADTLWVKR